MSQTANILQYVNDKKSNFCSLKLASGERIIIQTAAQPVYTIRIKKLKLRGLILGPTIWEYNVKFAGDIQKYFCNLFKMFTAELSFMGIGRNDAPTSHQQLDIIVGVLIHCTSIDQVRHVLLDRERLINVQPGKY